MSNILPKYSFKVSYTQKLSVSKKFDNFAKITLRVTETGPSILTHTNLNGSENSMLYRTRQAKLTRLS